MSAGVLEVRAYRAGDERGIIACSSRATGRSLTLDEWSFRNPLSPDGRRLVVAVRGEEIVGHLAGPPGLLQIDHRVVEARVLDGGAVDPSIGDEAERLALRKKLLNRLIAATGGAGPVVFLGGRDNARMWADVLEGGVIEPDSASVTVRNRAKTFRGRRLAYRAEPARDWEPRLEDLWARARGAYPAAFVRSPERVLSNYAGHPTERYHRFLAFPRFSARPVAFAAFRLAAGACLWADLVWDHRHPGALELLGHVSSRLAAQIGATSEACWFAGDRAGRELLSRLGFARGAPGMPVALAVRAETSVLAALGRPGALYVTEGDMGSH